MKRLSMHRSLQPLSLLAVFCTALAVCASTAARAQNASAKPQPRITSPIDSSSRATLAGSRPPRAAAADDLGAVPSTLQLHGISLLFSRSAAQQTALDALVAAQQNPASPLYHQWITPDQYAAQFGVADSDIAAAESWLEQQGFSVDSVSRSHNRILFSGTAAQVASAFGAPLHYYLTPATALQPAQQHFAPSADLTLPSALASSVLAIGNLSDFHLLPHILRTPQSAQPRFTSSATGNHYLTPGDLATIYDITPAYNSGFTGSNQSIAVVGQSAVNLSDIANFQNAVGIAGKTPIVVLVPDSGTSVVEADGDEAESDLDLEYSSTIAKGAQVYFVYTGNNTNFGAFNSIEYAIDNLVAPVVSSSYGDCEPNLAQSGYNENNSFLEQAAAQGQTVVSAAGDDGSTDCYGEYKSTQTAQNEQLAVDFPASSQYVTGVGGTEFPTADVAAGNNTYFDAQSSTDIISSAKSYIPEMVWNDDVAAASDGCPGTDCEPLSAGGGGVSVFTAQPTWQAGTIGGVAIPNNGHRMVPDIAMTASPFNAPLAFCTSDKTFWGTGQTASCTVGLRDGSSTGVLTVGGGTSFDAPTFSALVAIINQAKNFTTGQGVINPTLYSLAATSAYATAFHDITSGGNQCLSGATYCMSPGTTDYAATTGYDEASGLGSIDFFNLLTAWPSTTTTGSLLSTSTTLTAATITPASGAADAITITVAPVATNTLIPSGTVSVSVDGGTATSLQLTAGVATYSFSSTTAGAHVVTATYSGDTTFATSTGSITLTVGSAVPTGSFALAVSAAAVTVAPGASTTGTLTITPSGGFTGTVTLTTSSAPTLTNGCIVLASSSVAITGTTAGTANYTINTSDVPCPSGSVRPGSPTSSQVVARNPTPRHSSPWKQLPLPASLAGAFLLLPLRRSRVRSKLLAASLALGLVFSLSFSGLALIGCGGSTTTNNNVTTTTNDTPAGTYIITITGTSGTTTSSATVTLTVS
jgi:Pro-kumamolisin, activation domain/Bacterial Ig-like domain (group 3)